MVFEMGGVVENRGLTTVESTEIKTNITITLLPTGAENFASIVAEEKTRQDITVTI